MKQFLLIFSVVFFSIFLGSQITEGVLLVPFWQSLSSNDFYTYYDSFGPIISRFYTILTISAVLIPIVVSVYCFYKKSAALKYALLSSFFAVFFLSSFYVYFKGTNELFYQAALSDVELKNELILWAKWHWGRVLVECFSLIFLILALIKLPSFKD